MDEERFEIEGHSGRKASAGDKIAAAAFIMAALLVITLESYQIGAVLRTATTSGPHHAILVGPDGCMFNRVHCPVTGEWQDSFKWKDETECQFCGVKVKIVRLAH